MSSGLTNDAKGSPFVSTSSETVPSLWRFTSAKEIYVYLGVQHPFQEAGELDKVQQTLASVSKPVQYAAAVGLTAIAAALGFLLGSRSPGELTVCQIQLLGADPNSSRRLHFWPASSTLLLLKEAAQQIPKF